MLKLLTTPLKSYSIVDGHPDPLSSDNFCIVHSECTEKNARQLENASGGSLHCSLSSGLP